MGLRMCRKRVSSALIPLIFSSRALLIYVGFAWNANVLVLHSIDGNHCNLFEVSDNSARLLVFCLEQEAIPANFNHTDSTNVVCPKSVGALVMGIPQQR